MSAIKTKFQSSNFWVTVISILTLGLGLGAGSPIDIAPDAILDAFATKQGIGLIVFIMVNLANPLLRIVNKIRKGEFDWGFLRSPNFLTQVGTLLTIILTTWFDEQTTGIIIGLIGQGANWLWHILFDKQKDPLPGA